MLSEDGARGRNDRTGVPDGTTVKPGGLREFMWCPRPQALFAVITRPVACLRLVAWLVPSGGEGLLEGDRRVSKGIGDFCHCVTRFVQSFIPHTKVVT